MIRHLQHRAARIILNNFDNVNVRGNELLMQLGLQSLDQRRNYYMVTAMHKCIYKTAPVRLSNEVVYTSDTHDIATRASVNETVHIPESNCELFKTSFKYQSSLLWNYTGIVCHPS